MSDCLSMIGFCSRSSRVKWHSCTGAEVNLVQAAVSDKPGKQLLYGQGEGGSLSPKARLNSGRVTCPAFMAILSQRSRDIDDTFSFRFVCQTMSLPSYWEVSVGRQQQNTSAANSVNVVSLDSYLENRRFQAHKVRTSRHIIFVYSIYSEI